MPKACRCAWSIIGEVAEECGRGVLLRGDVRASCYSCEVVTAPLLSRVAPAFDRTTQLRGASYARGGHVLGLKIHGRTAEARVLGTRPAPYLVTVACPESAPDRLRT